MAPDGGGNRESLEAKHEIVLSTVDHIDAMIAYWDLDRVCRFANAAYRNWFGRGGEEVVGLPMEEFLGPTLYEMNLAYIDAAYGGETQVFEREVSLPDGGVRHSLATYTPHLSDGRVQGIFVHVADVTPLKLLEKELTAAKERAEQLATHDYLTGLPNRVLLSDQISAEIARAKRNDEVIAIMMIDMDGFKGVNDTYGHAAGDRLLVETAVRMKNAVREMDTVTRYGGDEFIVTAPQLESESHAASIAARLLATVRVPFRFEEARLSPTFSLGIALYPSHGSTPDELIRCSDSALYSAKRLGKNRYAFYGGPSRSRREPPTESGPSPLPG